MSTAAQQIRTTGQSVGHGDWVERAGRVGLVAKGASYALIGILAIQIPWARAGRPPIGKAPCASWPPRTGDRRR